jgi:hypothetical protein
MEFVFGSSILRLVLGDTLKIVKFINLYGKYTLIALMLQKHQIFS